MFRPKRVALNVYDVPKTAQICTQDTNKSIGSVHANSAGTWSFEKRTGRGAKMLPKAGPIIPVGFAPAQFTTKFLATGSVAPTKEANRRVTSSRLALAAVFHHCAAAAETAPAPPPTLTLLLHCFASHSLPDSLSSFIVPLASPRGTRPSLSALVPFRLQPQQLESKRR